jgi:hypothetical protein
MPMDMKKDMQMEVKKPVTNSSKFEKWIESKFE